MNDYLKFLTIALGIFVLSFSINRNPNTNTREEYIRGVHDTLNTLELINFEVYMSNSKPSFEEIEHSIKERLYIK